MTLALAARWCTRSSRALLSLAFALLAAFATPAAAGSRAWTELPRTLVLLVPGAPGGARAFVAAVEAAGGHVSVVTSPRVAVVYADDSVLASSALRPFLADVHRGRVEPATWRSHGAEARRALGIWEAALEIESQSPLAEDDLPRVPDAGPRPVKLPEPPGDEAVPGSDLWPLGSQYYDTSEFLAGSCAVGVWLLESAGASYEWTVANENLTVGGVQSGLDNWVRKGGSAAALTFFLDVHLRVPVSGVPIEHPIGMDDVWVNEVLTNAGWAGADAFDRCFAYNNSIRASFGTNWCHSIFVVDSAPLVNQGLFAGGGYAFAYYGGPYVWMSRMSTWAYNSAAYYAAVPMHESGHIFMTTDEYDGVTQFSGYLNVADLNGASCIMNRNDTTRVCANSRAQLGWRDTDGDGVFDVLDTPPAVALAAHTPDPTPGPSLVWSGTASVTMLANQNPNSNYFPPHAQTIARVQAVQWRIDAGAWAPAIPADGAFDGYSEAFVTPAVPLPDGLHVLEARAGTTAGVWSESFASDTVTVLGSPVDVPPGIIAPPRLLLSAPSPNPMHGDGVLRFRLARAERVWLEILDLGGRRVRRLVGGEQYPAGSHELQWDGSAERGERVASGVYVVSLSTRDETAVQRIVFLR